MEEAVNECTPMLLEIFMSFTYMFCEMMTFSSILNVNKTIIPQYKGLQRENKRRKGLFI